MSCLRLSCRMVSLTSRNTSLMFSVLMAVVKWWYRGFTVASRLLARKHSTMNAWTSGRLCSCPVYSGKSVLLRKRMMETLMKTRLLTMVSKMSSDSRSRLVCLSSISTCKRQ
ncbi:hypothetical protein F7725_014510, partial [Dissostichus mawsoni]